MKSMRRAADFADGDGESDEAGDQQPRVSLDRHQDARPEHHPHPDPYHKSTKQFHAGNVTGLGRRFNRRFQAVFTNKKYWRPRRAFRNIGRGSFTGLSDSDMKAKIIITPKKAVVDPQGKAVQNALEHMGYNGITAVHVGKFLEIELNGADKETARRQLDEACHRFLSNPVIEDYKLELE